jgi:hypothetical protein
MSVLLTALTMVGTWAALLVGLGLFMWVMTKLPTPPNERCPHCGQWSRSKPIKPS